MGRYFCPFRGGGLGYSGTAHWEGNAQLFGWSHRAAKITAEVQSCAPFQTLCNASQMYMTCSIIRPTWAAKSNPSVSECNMSVRALGARWKRRWLGRGGIHPAPRIVGGIHPVYKRLRRKIFVGGGYLVWFETGGKIPPAIAQVQIAHGFQTCRMI